MFTKTLKFLIIFALVAQVLLPFSSSPVKAAGDYLDAEFVPNNLFQGGVMSFEEFGFTHGLAPEYNVSEFREGRPIFFRVSVKNNGNVPLSYEMHSNYEAINDPDHDLRDALQMSFCRLRNLATDPCTEIVPALGSSDPFPYFYQFSQSNYILQPGDVDHWFFTLKILDNTGIADELSGSVGFTANGKQPGFTGSGGFTYTRSTPQRPIVFYNDPVPKSIVFNELFYYASDPSKSFIELYNNSEFAYDLAGDCEAGQTESWRVAISEGATEYTSYSFDGAPCSSTLPPDRSATTVEPHTMVLLVPPGGRSFITVNNELEPAAHCTVANTCLPGTKVIELPSGDLFDVLYTSPTLDVKLIRPESCEVPYSVPCPRIPEPEYIVDQVALGDFDPTGTETPSNFNDDLPNWGGGAGQSLARVWTGNDTNTLADWAPTKDPNPGKTNLAINEVGTEDNNLQFENNPVNPFIEVYNASYHDMCIDGFVFKSTASLDVVTLDTPPSGCANYLGGYDGSPVHTEPYYHKVYLEPADIPVGFMPSEGTELVTITLAQLRTFRGVDNHFLTDQITYMPGYKVPDPGATCTDCDVRTTASFSRDVGAGNGVGPFYATNPTPGDYNGSPLDFDASETCVQCTPTSFSAMSFSSSFSFDSNQGGVGEMTDEPAGDEEEEVLLEDEVNAENSETDAETPIEGMGSEVVAEQLEEETDDTTQETAPPEEVTEQASEEVSEQAPEQVTEEVVESSVDETVLEEDPVAESTVPVEEAATPDAESSPPPSPEPSVTQPTPDTPPQDPVPPTDP